MSAINVLKEKMAPEHFAKVEAIGNDYLNEFLVEMINWLKPSGIFVSDGSDKDREAIRKFALDFGEERKLKAKNHTVHFDNIKDQARDKAHTKILLPKGAEVDPNLNTMDREEGLKEIREIMDGIMQGKTMFILFFTLGPNNSIFSIPAVQITDSAYVAHSENILYRNGYEDFKNMEDKKRFFRFVHSAGELDEMKTSKNLDKRRIYIDLEDNITYSANTQYGGNTIGLKKLAMRLAINTAVKEGWLCEHMFVMGVKGPNGRKSYFTGAYPSACGKTSTSMLPNESIVGDDIAHLRVKDGRIYGVNVEKGMFGIIDGVNEKDDPLIWQALHDENKEVIFVNILVQDDGTPYWTGSGKPEPKGGINFSGQWWQGKTDENGNPIPPSHKNARFTVSLEDMPNVDENLHNPEGVEISGVIYGGRDSDTWVPVEEAFDWEHGIITKGASLESETTAATLGKIGERKFNPMSNLDFLSVPIARYIQANLDFGKKADKTPKIFSVNYFLKDKNGNFLNSKLDKYVWLKWMELRCHDEAPAVKTPTGLIPDYETLKRLFKEILNKDYSEEDYAKQFTIRIPENLAKMDRIIEIYKTKIPNTPDVVFRVLEEQKKRLEEYREKYGDYISPFDLK